MNWFELYLLTRLESLKDLSAMAGVAAACAIFACAMGATYPCWEDATRKLWIRYLKLSIASLAASLTIYAFIPTERDLAVIIAGHWASNSDEMKKLPDNVAKTLNSLLDAANAKLQEK